MKKIPKLRLRLKRKFALLLLGLGALLANKNVLVLKDLLMAPETAAELPFFCNQQGRGSSPTYSI